LHCKSPNHERGHVNLTISRDGKEFSDGVLFTFERKGWFSFWLFAVPLGLVGGLFTFAWLKRNRVPKRRRRKVPLKSTLNPTPKAKGHGVSRRQVASV
jgi:hypothetical protein